MLLLPRIYLLLGTRRSFFDDAASTETQAHRSNGPYQRISLRHLLCSATICSTPMQGTRSWDRVYCCPTAAKPPVERAGHSTFLRYLQVKIRSRRVDSNR
jgi:hypothetical protein